MRPFCFSTWFLLKNTFVNRFASFLLAALLPGTAAGMVGASLTWTASTDPTVTGYNIYYGSASGQYTNKVAVGDVTNAVLPDLSEDITYFFAAKAYNAAGNESPFSNEAIFCGFTVTPGTYDQQSVIPTNTTGDQLTFSLAGDVPPGATIDPTNGTFAWCPGLDYASTTNALIVTINDNTNPSLSSSETLLIVVTDYLQVGLGTTAIQTGQPGVLPIILGASDEITNLQFTVAWPGGQLGTPTLTFAPPVVAGSLQMQNSTAVVQMQIDPGQSFAGSNTIAQLNFQALPAQPSAFVNVPITGASGIKSDASSYANVIPGSGQVVVVGANPLLQFQASASQGDVLNLFGHPGATYQVQSTTNLTPPIVWAPLLNHEQSDVNDSLNLDGSQPAIFFRLQQL